MVEGYNPFNHVLFGRVASLIISEYCGMNRLTYDITSKRRGKIERE